MLQRSGIHDSPEIRTIVSQPYMDILNFILPSFVTRMFVAEARGHGLESAFLLRFQVAFAEISDIGPLELPQALGDLDPSRLAYASAAVSPAGPHVHASAQSSREHASAEVTLVILVEAVSCCLLGRQRPPHS